MATIDEVAVAAGVSMKTVSRVLNNEPHVRPAMQARVLEAVAALGYQPNQAARRLAGGKSSMVAYLYNNPSPSYVALVQSGAALRSRELGLHLIVEPIELDGEERFVAIQRMLTTIRPDGVFVIPPLSDDAELLAELSRLGLPTARIAGTTPFDGWNIELPERDGGRMVVEHLIGLGHERIAMIGPPVDHTSAAARVDGYRDAMSAGRLHIHDGWVADGSFDFASGAKLAGIMLDSEVRPTAIFAANDEMALGAMSAARHRGLTIPETLSVAGFDDTPASASSWPALTTVRQPLEIIGRAVIDLIAREQQPPPLDFELIVRDSTAAPPE